VCDKKLNLRLRLNLFLQAILAKMERALEIKLRGKDKGAPLAPKTPAAAPAAKGKAGHGK
jgi:hypothetical protein